MNKEVIIPLEFHLRHLADRIKKSGRSQLQAYQLSDTQFIAVQWIHEEPLTVGQLASKMGIAVSTASEMVDQLIKKECVRREKDATDKRKVNLYPEQKSIEIINKVISKRQEFLNELMADIPVDKQMMTAEVIKQLFDKMEASS
ncbi:MarR family transcriptional regulator [Macrococcus brunensis]|uniref:MarR family transcriptional regulator n=1 Tax=Macrococcus brunensis TaxID=198483 RepID=A0A4R6BD13_9STAP|nr:MarR family transcriptional regulator [Macrococcus brunensis]TDL96728.1 MarR family transcriptional regulator [Macrococcus brunensis]ULG73097.1 MarR family transcriptional regulator [Macrococcus brunensis]ULG75276.1 MarR family transcriptional regulator [Macrococcus brunensis]